MSVVPPPGDTQRTVGGVVSPSEPVGPESLHETTANGTRQSKPTVAAARHGLTTEPSLPVPTRRLSVASTLAKNLRTGRAVATRTAQELRSRRTHGNA